jgi:hypothetical protein
VTTINAVLSTLQTAVGAVSGVKFAPDDPPEDAGDFPFMVTYFEAFRAVLNTPEDFRALYDVTIELHVARKDLPEDVNTLLPYAETVLNVIFKTMRDNSYAYEGEITGSFGVLPRWGDTQSIGFSWTIGGVKVITSIT